MTKKQADRFLHWLYGWMKNRTTFLRFKFLDEDTLAEFLAYRIDDTVDIFDVPIDPTGPILVSVIHEGLHCRYPEKEEEEIVRMTHQVAGHLTLKQWHNLFKRMGEEVILAD